MRAVLPDAGLSGGLPRTAPGRGAAQRNFVCTLRRVALKWSLKWPQLGFHMTRGWVGNGVVKEYLHAKQVLPLHISSEVIINT